jgi:hypothetical protein
MNVYNSLRCPRYRGCVLQHGRHDNHLAKVSGKFSIRLVPPQTPENVDTLVINYYLSAEFVKRKSTINAENLMEESLG